MRIIPATLPSGLRVVLVADPKASEVQVTMRYRVGANDDPKGQEGIAHLVEHLMLQPVLGAQTLFAKLQDTTTFFNAFTSPDATTYIARANPSRLTELLSVDAVRLGFRCTAISETVYEREREVVLNELRLREASLELRHALHQAVYPDGHPYRRNFGGTIETVSAITREQTCAFAESHYGPSNAVLVISGPVTIDQVNEALGKHIANVPARLVQPPVEVPPVPAQSRRIDAKVPIDEKAILVAWPLPRDAMRLSVVNVGTRLVRAIAARGFSAQYTILGDAGAEVFALFVAFDDDEKRSSDELVKVVEGAVRAFPSMFRYTQSWLAKMALDQLKQQAIYSAFSSLEEGSERDTAIAASVLASRDPNEALVAQSAALNKLGRDEFERIAATNFRYEDATVAVLSPTDAKKRGAPVKLTPPVHDIGQLRDPPDPEEAKHPADAIPKQDAIAGMRKRTLANGLDVVLLPVTSVPTVEIRLVFGSGTAADPVTERGSARAAAKALVWSSRFLDDFVGFAAGGGTLDSDVGVDHTVFIAKGVDMHLDLLLAGLRRWVRDGIYDADDIRAIRDRKNEPTLMDAWRVALFGANHPYSHEETVSPSLALEAVKAYRKTHHTPDNATLVIAGRFDADLADRWIDHLFADWKGTTPQSITARPTTQPISIANDDDATQVIAAIAMPAGRGSRAQQLVTAAMLNVIVQDVRHQLGASYSIDAELDENRLATTYLIAGSIDARRVRDAFELVRVRIAALRADPEAAARTFITARRRVIVNLLRSTSSAYELAERVQRDIELERPPLSDAQTAVIVKELTIDAMTDMFAELDLSRAVVVLRGPKETIDDAFAALNRTPTRIAISDDDDTVESETVSESDVEHDPSRQSKSLWRVGLFFGYNYATADDHGVEGFSLSTDIGRRLGRRLATGFHASIANLDGTKPPPLVGDDPLPVSASAYRLAGFLQLSPSEDARTWGSIFLGASVVNVNDNGAETTNGGFVIGAHGGYDVANFSNHHITVYGRVDADIASSGSFAGFTFGVGYRHR